MQEAIDGSGGTYATKATKIQTRLQSIILNVFGVELGRDSTDETAMAGDWEQKEKQKGKEQEKYRNKVSPAKKISVLILAPTS